MIKNHINSFRYSINRFWQDCKYVYSKLGLSFMKKREIVKFLKKNDGNDFCYDQNNSAKPEGHTRSNLVSGPAAVPSSQFCKILKLAFLDRVLQALDNRERILWKAHGLLSFLVNDCLSAGPRFLRYWRFFAESLDWPAPSDEQTMMVTISIALVQFALSKITLLVNRFKYRQTEDPKDNPRRRRK